MMTIREDIRTPRLILRPAGETDPVVLNALIQDPRIYRNAGTIPPNQPLEETIRIQRERATRAGEGRGAGFHAYLNGEMIGLAGGGENAATGIVDFGYWIVPAHWGHGFATEAGLAVLGWFVRVQGRRQFTASHFKDNPASGAVLRKLGFRRIGEGWHPCAGREEDVACDEFVWPASPDVLRAVLEADDA